MPNISEEDQSLFACSVPHVMLMKVIEDESLTLLPFAIYGSYAQSAISFRYSYAEVQTGSVALTCWAAAN